RDHYVEEVLGIAYPPLDERRLERESMAYLPSGYDEIVHAFDATELGPGDRFLDIGSGMGKATMLAALLTGATSFGVEHDESLHELAEVAACALHVEGVHCRRDDAREAVLDEAEVVFMYLPFTGSVLSNVMARLMERRPEGARARRRFLCAAAVDLGRYRDL